MRIRRHPSPLPPDSRGIEDIMRDSRDAAPLPAGRIGIRDKRIGRHPSPLPPDPIGVEDIMRPEPGADPS